MGRDQAKRSLPSAVLLRGLFGSFAVAAAGCTTVTQGGAQQTALMKATHAEATPGEMRAVENVLAIRVPGTVEAAADAIRTRSTDPGLRRRALLWKIEVIPAFYLALFNGDPLAAVLDAWVLSIQIEQWLESGPGKEAFSPLQSVAIEAARKVRLEIEAAATRVARSPQGFERARTTVETWAHAHPIDGPLSSRPSILPELAEMAAAGTEMSVFQAVGNIPATVADLATRIDIYTAQLPGAARWQAELLTEQMVDGEDVQRILATLRSVEALTDRTNVLLAPEGLQAALDIATGRVRGERIAALASIDQQRVETLAYLTREREAMVAAIGVERRDAMADVDRQRLALMQQLDDLRRHALTDADQLASRIIQRGALAVAVLLLFAAALTLAVLRLAPRRRAPGGTPA
jgi:hypothetical protein